MAITKIRGSKQIEWDGNIDFGSRLLSTTGVPTDAGHVVNKLYVDNLSLGLDAKQSVKCMNNFSSYWGTEPTYSNGTNGVGAALTFTGASAYFDGTIVEGDRVLVNYFVGATGRVYNGIYIVGNLGGSQQTFTRATDFNSTANTNSGAFVFVETGSTYADSGWTLITDGTYVFGTTVFLFVQFSGAGQITPGAGLTKDGNTLNAVGTANRITVNADSIDIASTYVGQTSITKLGTITDGTWNGTTIAIANGGTGATTAATARTNLGLAIGTNVQAWDADLDTIAGLAKTDGNFIVGNGTTWVVESGATVRTSLGLTIGTDVQAYDADLKAIGDLTGTTGILRKTAANTWELASDVVTLAGTQTLTNKTLTAPKIDTIVGETVSDTISLYTTSTGVINLGNGSSTVNIGANTIYLPGGGDVSIGTSVSSNVVDIGSEDTAYVSMFSTNIQIGLGQTTAPTIGIGGAGGTTTLNGNLTLANITGGMLISSATGVISAVTYYGTPVTGAVPSSWSGDSATFTQTGATTKTNIQIWANGMLLKEGTDYALTNNAGTQFVVNFDNSFAITSADNVLAAYIWK